MGPNLLALYAEAWSQPRQSMRRILGLNLSERDRIIMVAITGFLFAIPAVLIIKTIALPVGDDGVPIAPPSTFSVAVLTVGIIILSYYVTAALIRVVGAVFGGQANYIESKTVSAWAQFVTGTANLALLFASFVLPGALDQVLRLLFTIGALYVFSSYVAEAHGFQNILKVIGVMIAISFLLSLALMSQIPAEMLRPHQ